MFSLINRSTESNLHRSRILKPDRGKKNKNKKQTLKQNQKKPCNKNKKFTICQTELNRLSDRAHYDLLNLMVLRV